MIQGSEQSRHTSSVHPVQKRVRAGNPQCCPERIKTFQDGVDRDTKEVARFRYLAEAQVRTVYHPLLPQERKLQLLPQVSHEGPPAKGACDQNV